MKRIPIPSDGLARVLGSGLEHLGIKNSDPSITPFVSKIFKGLDIFFGAVGRMSQGREADDFVGCVVLEPEPDIEITVHFSRYLRARHVKDVIARLKQDLPGLEIRTTHQEKKSAPRPSQPEDPVPQDIFQIEDDQPIPHQLSIIVGRESLMRALEQTNAEYYREPYAKLKRRVALNNRAVQSASEEGKAEPDALFIAGLVNPPLVNDPYFRTECLERLMLEEGRDVPLIWKPAIYHWLSKPETIRAVVNYLKEEKGIGKLTYVGRGARSIAFASQPDREGKPQVVLFSPKEDQKPDTPFHLPAYESKVCGNARVRIMPMLPRKDDKAQKRMADEMDKTLRTYKLSTHDIREPNVGEYEYTDSTGAHRVTMILDWDAGPQFLSEEQAARLDVAKELDPWRAACAHIAQHGVHADLSTHQQTAQKAPGAEVRRG